MNYIIFDLEATCWEREKGKFNEIIEVGAVKINEELDTVDTFSQFVRPVLDIELSDFCTELTTIKQEDVDSAETFETVMRDFEAWSTSSDGDVIFCSWGFYDKKQIVKESEKKNYNGSIRELINNHISIKHQFAEIYCIKPCGMKRALEILGLELQGTHHRGIDDANNIAKIFKTVFSKIRF